MELINQNILSLFKLVLIFFFLSFSSCTSQDKINGLSYVSAAHITTQKQVSNVTRVHANYVAIMPYAYLKSLDYPEVRYNESYQWHGETSEGITQYISMFNKNKVEVMLKPQIWVNRGDYTGYITMKSEEDWQTLEKTYSKYILEFAQIAENLQVAMFCIGTELEKFVIERPEYFKQLIKEIRKIYKGKLTYAANWDEFKRVSFWSELDYIGIDAYFPLSDEKTPSLESLKRGWIEPKKLMHEYALKYDKQILFTEFGYRSIDYNTVKPWEIESENKEVNEQAQVNALQASFDEFWQEDWFAGGFIWKWFTVHEKVGGKNNNRFTPQNKLAEKTILNFYKNN